MDCEKALIPQFYAGKSIFITGGTGFMGKVLVQRLLATCPDIGNIYLLMRTKRDVAPETRLKQLKQGQVFDSLRDSNPGQLDKIKVITGDTSLPGLGISEEVLKELNEVSIVFHSAATLKFDEALKKAVDQNIRSVMWLMDICDNLPKMDALIHVSTAYSNSEKSYVEEKVYPPPVPLHELLDLVDNNTDEILAEITPNYIKPKPNTYCFTKALAENAVIEHQQRKYNVAIFRPSIVISAKKYPYPGWIENLNGPSGVIVGAGKGVLRVFTCKSTAKADLLPVDIAIDCLCAAARETTLNKSTEIKVYNCSTSENPTDWAQFKKIVHKSIRQNPLDGALWYPFTVTVESPVLERCLQTVIQTIPLHLMAYGMRILNIKQQISLITTEQKIRSMNNVLKFFSLTEWKFETTNIQKLRASLSQKDREIYNLDPNTIDWNEHIADFVKGTRKYLLKENEQNLKKARTHLNRIWYLHYGTMFLVVLFIFRILFSKYVHVRELFFARIKMMSSLLCVGL